MEHLVHILYDICILERKNTKYKYEILQKANLAIIFSQEMKPCLEKKYHFCKLHSLLPYLQWRHAFPRNTCLLQTSQKENLNTRVLSNLENKMFRFFFYLICYSSHWEKRICSNGEREREMCSLNKIEIGLTCIHCIWYRERRSFLYTHYMLIVLWDYSTWEKERYCCGFDLEWSPNWTTPTQW